MSKEQIEIKNYDDLFKNLLSKESNYEFFLKAQSSLKRELQKNPNSTNYISLLLYCINHLKESQDKQSVNSLLDFSLEQYTRKNNKIPESVPKQQIIEGFLKAFNLCSGLFNTNNFRIKFLYYCKKNEIDEKELKSYKCYDIFAKGCIEAKEYVDAYNYCIKCENLNLIFELFDNFEKIYKNKESDINDENPLYNYKIIFKQLDKEEYEILILRTCLEFLINKKIELAFDFISKYYKKNNSENNSTIINFGYNLVCLLIRQPKGFDNFWSLINIYKGVVEKRFDIQKYLNKISKVYYDKTFLSEDK